MADIRDALAELGITIIRSVRREDGGTEYEARCPYHHKGTRADHSPSWSINDETGAHFCQSCGFGGSLAWLYHKVGDIPLEEAQRRTRALDNSLSRLLLRDALNEPRQVRPSIPMSRARLLALDDPPDWALEARQLTRQAVVDYEVRWDSRRNAWVTPIRDAEDPAKVIGIQVKGQLDRYFRNLPGTVPKASTVFGIEHLPVSCCAVVESPLDAVRLHGLGIDAVSTMGARISQAQVEILVANVDMVVFALDDDESGDKGKFKALKSLRKRVRVYDVSFAGLKAKDPGEMTDAQILERFSEPRSAVFYGSLLGR